MMPNVIVEADSVLLFALLKTWGSPQFLRLAYVMSIENFPNLMPAFDAILKDRKIVVHQGV